MSYAVEHDNDRDGQADGPYRTGVYDTVAEAKAAGDRLAAKDGIASIVVRDEGDKVSIFAGNVVSELLDGEWRDLGIVDVQNWWPKLDERTRIWLLEHAEERIPTEVLHRVVAVGGIVPGTSWEGHDYEFRLPEAAVDWIAAQR